MARRYADPKVRGYSDIDLLVPSEELPGWSEVLKELGYVGPRGWHEEHARRYKHHVPYRRRIGNRVMLCELHVCMFMEHRARQLDYSALITAAEPGAFPGMVELQTPAQIVVLALHLFHHRNSDRRLIWFRDFLEMGTPEEVEAARSFAATHGVRWALEWALHEVEKLRGARTWQASPEDDAFGLARVLQLESPGHLYQLALLKELGPQKGAHYLFSRLDPRRFRYSPEGSARATVSAVISRNLKVALRTPWLKAFSRRR